MPPVTFEHVSKRFGDVEIEVLDDGHVAEALCHMFEGDGWHLSLHSGAGHALDEVAL